MKYMVNIARKLNDPILVLKIDQTNITCFFCNPVVYISFFEVSPSRGESVSSQYFLSSPQVLLGLLANIVSKDQDDHDADIKVDVVFRFKMLCLYNHVFSIVHVDKILLDFFHP